MHAQRPPEPTAIEGGSDAGAVPLGALRSTGLPRFSLRPRATGPPRSARLPAADGLVPPGRRLTREEIAADHRGDAPRAPPRARGRRTRAAPPSSGPHYARVEHFRLLQVADELRRASDQPGDVEARALPPDDAVLGKRPGHDRIRRLAIEPAPRRGAPQYVTRRPSGAATVPASTRRSLTATPSARLIRSSSA